MFHIKDILSRVTHGQSPNSPARNNEPDTAEGFLCPLCMQAFTTQDELQNHYSASHKNFEPPSGMSSSNEEVNVFQSFHQGVGGRYKQAQAASIEVEDAEESAPEINSTNIQVEPGEVSPEMTVQDLMEKLKDLIKQNELIAEEKRQVEQRAAALAEKVVTWKATVDEEESEIAALTNRLAVVEAQLAHRENIDDAAVLRQELIQVQRVMDEMTREREMESDQLKRDLQNLQQKYDLLKAERDNCKPNEENMKSVELLEESLMKKDELIEKLSDELTMLKETVSTLESESFQKNSKLMETENNLENSRLILDELNSKNENNRKRIAELEERLMQALLDLEKSKEEERSMKEWLNCVEENAMKNNQTISDLRLELSNVLNEIQDKNKELSILNEKIQSLISELKDSSIKNEDLSRQNEEMARSLDERIKLVNSLMDKENGSKSTIHEHFAEMDHLHKNYVDLKTSLQAQLDKKNETISDCGSKLLNQIELTIELLSKKSRELISHDTETFKSVHEGLNSNEEVIQMLQSQLKEKSEQLIESQKRINTIMEEKRNGEIARTDEYEAKIISMNMKLEQCQAELLLQHKLVDELKEKLAKEELNLSQKDEEIQRLRSKKMALVIELEKTLTLCSYIKNENKSFKNALSSLSQQFTESKKNINEKLMNILKIYGTVEREAEELPKVRENLINVSDELKRKDSENQNLMLNLDISNKKFSELEEEFSKKKSEIEELKSLIEQHKEENFQLNCTISTLSEQQSKMKDYVIKCENKIKSLNADLLALEKLKADGDSQNQILEAKLKTDLHEKEMVIQELNQAKEVMFKQQLELKKEMEVLENKYQVELKECHIEIDQLKSSVSREELQKEELKKNLEEELLAKTALEREFSLFKTRSETDLTILNDNIKSLTRELNQREEMEKVKDRTIEKLQEQNSTMKTEWEAERQALLERYIESTKENERLQGTTNDLRRRLEDSQAALHEIGRENQTYQIELAKLSGRKWTEDADVTNCMKCAKEFSIRLRKHHCRNCGQIFCNDCSSKMAAIASNKKPVRVCEACYIELVPN